MLFGKRRARSAFVVSLLAGLAFIALSIYGWDLPLASAGKFLLISLLMVLALMALALCVVLLRIGFKRLWLLLAGRAGADKSSQ